MGGQSLPLAVPAQCLRSARRMRWSSRVDLWLEYGVVDRIPARARRIGALPALLNPVVQSRSTIVRLSRLRERRRGLQNGTC